MRRLTLAAVLLLLLLSPSVLMAEKQVDAAPEWRVGDRWEYTITVEGPAGRTYGNMSQQVSAVGQVRVGNRTVDAYTLRTRQTHTGFGVNSTTTSTTHIARSDIGTLDVNSTSATNYEELRSQARMELRYDPSDGRYRFPLRAGADWNAEYNVSRRVLLSSAVILENRTAYAQFSCEGPEELSVAAGRFLAFKITCTLDSGNQTIYWYSDAVRGDVMKSELDRRTGALTVSELNKYMRQPEPLPLLGTDIGRATLLGGISAVLVFTALALHLVRRKNIRAHRPKKVEEAPAPSFHFEKTREGLQMTVETISLSCPACRRVFKVPKGTLAVKCPFCGKQGRLG